MRLIDADELIKDRVENDPVRIAAQASPTVYDIEEVSFVIQCLLNPFFIEEKESMLRAIENIIRSGMCKKGDIS